jgi:hypothetical protein
MNRPGFFASLGMVRLVVLLPVVFAGLGFAQNPEGVNYFRGISGDEWVKANAKEAEQHFAAWKSAQGAERKREADIARFYAWRAERTDMIDQIIADGRLAETEVRAPADTGRVRVKVKHEIPHQRVVGRSTQNPIWRRITPSAFEMWTPGKGWLFNSRGDLLNTAVPSRKKSQGRQWFGAFIPDGRWLTTELRQDDGRVYIFNRKGRCTRGINAAALLENDPETIRFAKSELVPWARSTGEGEGWIVRVGSEQGRGESLLNPDGTWRKLAAPSSPWRHCMARQLGIRLSDGNCDYSVESDDGEVQMFSAQAGHGVGVGNPSYEITSTRTKDAALRIGLDEIPGDGRGFGFWPRSRSTYILGTNGTWFFDAAGNYRGWIAGARVGDAAGGKSMIFRLKDGRCATVSPELKVTRTERFTLADGRRILPLELHPDIGLGVFAVRGKSDTTSEELDDTEFLVDTSRTVLLARWESAPTKKPRAR